MFVWCYQSSRLVSYDEQSGLHSGKPSEKLFTIRYKSLLRYKVLNDQRKYILRGRQL